MKSTDLQLQQPPYSDPILFHHSTGQVIAGLMVEQIEFSGNTISIIGWSIGSLALSLFRKKKNDTFILKRHSRLDVAQKYFLQETQAAEFGFTLTSKATIEDIFNLSCKFPKIKENNSFQLLIPTKKFITKESTFNKITPLVPTVKKLKIATDILPKFNENVLIIGSAPSIKTYHKKIKNFKGERWALNDSWFWLEEQGVTVDKVFITDSRFIKKSVKKIEASNCPTIVTTHTVELNLINHITKNAFIFQSLGRDGFSQKYGQVFHGCSVFFTAIQTAFAQKYQHIAVCGVSLPPPASYFRIDGSNTMPEYVHNIQLSNAHLALSKLREFDINLDIFEPESNLNFL